MFQATGVVQLSKAFWVVQNRLSHQKALFGDRAPWSLSAKGVLSAELSAYVMWWGWKPEQNWAMQQAESLSK